MMQRRNRTLAMVGLCAGLVLAARADVKLNGMFTDNLVLQRDTLAPVWGWADEGEEITVAFRGQQVKTKAKDGCWMVRLNKLTAGGPDDLTVTGKNTVTLKNVLVGEVWIASGQSNMEWPLRASYQAESDIASSANPMLRLYAVPKLKAEAPSSRTFPRTGRSANRRPRPISARWPTILGGTCNGR